MTCPAYRGRGVGADVWVDDFAKQQYGGGLHLSPQDLSCILQHDNMAVWWITFEKRTAST